MEDAYQGFGVDGRPIERRTSTNSFVSASVARRRFARLSGTTSSRFFSSSSSSFPSSSFPSSSMYSSSDSVQDWTAAAPEDLRVDLFRFVLGTVMFSERTTFASGRRDAGNQTRYSRVVHVYVMPKPCALNLECN